MYDYVTIEFKHTCYTMTHLGCSCRTVVQHSSQNRISWFSHWLTITIPELSVFSVYDLTPFHFPCLSQGKVYGFVPMGDSNPDTEATASSNAVGFVRVVIIVTISIVADWNLDAFILYCFPFILMWWMVYVCYVLRIAIEFIRVCQLFVSKLHILSLPVIVYGATREFGRCPGPRGCSCQFFTPGLSLLEARLLEKPFGCHAVGGPQHMLTSSVSPHCRILYKSQRSTETSWRGILSHLFCGIQLVPVRLATTNNINQVYKPHWANHSSIETWSRTVSCWKICSFPSPTAKIVGSPISISEMAWCHEGPIHKVISHSSS